MIKEQGFNEWADRYDEQVLKAEGYPFEGYKSLLDYYEKQLTITDHTKILDIGIGTGLLSKILSEKGANITGIDFSEKMITIAKSRIPNGEFYQYDLNKGLPIEIKDIKYDYIISNYVFHHFHVLEKVELIRKLKENIKPNGKIIIGDVGFLTNEDLLSCKETYKKVWDEDEIYMVKDELSIELEKAGLDFKYEQISLCTAILTIII